MPYSVIKPDNWPQDAMEVPSYPGMMPPIEFANKSIVGGEYFALTQRCIFAPATVAFTTQTFTIATPQDGDLWCDQIAMVSFLYTGAAQGVLNVNDVVVTIKDVKTGHSPIYCPPFKHPPNATIAAGQILLPANAVPLSLFRKFPQEGLDGGFLAYDGETPLPAGFRDTGTLIQPTCFTRQGGIEVAFTNISPTVAWQYDITLMFSGWKEYDNAV